MYRQSRESIKIHNVCEQVTIGFCFISDWIRKWREFLSQSLNLRMQKPDQLWISFYIQSFEKQCYNVILLIEAISFNIHVLRTKFCPFDRTFSKYRQCHARKTFTATCPCKMSQLFAVGLWGRWVGVWLMGWLVCDQVCDPWPNCSSLCQPLPDILFETWSMHITCRPMQS